MSNTPHHSPDFRWEPIDRTKPWDRNPRLNDGAVPKVAASIRRFGFVSPMVVWRSRRQVVAGHTRRKALESILAVDPTFVPKGAPRAGVVPVRYHEFESDAEAAAYAIADNKLNEAAEWDTGELASLMGEIGEMDSELAAVVGFSADELAAFPQPGAGVPDAEGGAALSITAGGVPKGAALPVLRFGRWQVELSPADVAALEARIEAFGKANGTTLGFGSLLVRGLSHV